MAVLTVREQFEGRSDSETFGDEVSKTRVFKVKTSSAYDTLSNIQHPDLPVPWSRHPLDNRLICQGREGSNSDSASCIWRLTYSYSSRITPGSALQNMSQGYSPDQAEDPTQRPALIRWSYSTFRKAITKCLCVGDSAGNQNKFRGSDKQSKSLDVTNVTGILALTNSAGVPFVSPLEVDEPRLTLTVTKNISKPYDWMLRMNNCVNDGAVNIDGLVFERGRLKATVSLGTSQMDRDFRYRELSMEFHFLEEGWDVWLLDQGKTELVLVTDKSGALTTQQKKIVDSNGEPVADPVLLDGSGNKLANQKDDPYFRVCRPYEFKSFSPLIPYLV